MGQPLEYVFSLRSPYAWLASVCVIEKLPPETEVCWRPFFPLPSFANFGAPVQGKFEYNVRDVMRLAKHYGLPLKWHAPEDPDWRIPHAAFARADEHGVGKPFALAMYSARYLRGEDVSLPEVIATAAEVVGLDAGEIVDASRDATLQERLVSQVQSDYDERGIFGVPTLILPRGTRFWGHDRIDWALREGYLDEAIAAAQPGASPQTSRGMS